MDLWPTWDRWGPELSKPAPLATSAVAGLPIELWEKIIDIMADEPLLQLALRRTALVCRSFVPRCRYHLCTHASISSSDSLVTFEQIIKSSPGFPARVLSLCIDGRADGVASWVSHFPITLPRLPNLRKIEIQFVDLTQQNPQFWRFMTLLPCPMLLLNHVRYSQSTQISRLVSAVQPQAFSLQWPHQSEHKSNPHPLLSHPPIKQLDTLIACFNPWNHSVTFLQGWTFSGPILRDITIVVENSTSDDDSEPAAPVVSFATAGFWNSVVRMFQPLGRPDNDTMTVLIDTPIVTVTLRRAKPPADRSPTARELMEQNLDVIFNNHSTQSDIPLIIRILSSLTFDSVTLRFTSRVWRTVSAALWRQLDEEFSRPRFVGLDFIEIKEDQDPDYFSRDPPLSTTAKARCSKDVFAEAFPTAASRGLLRSDCREWTGCEDHASR
ncbi:hypothetical protein BXZ70DRAFT_685978 [Cristinia sonorae]|uniref:Uncharacterized protein n=1 Tax=Cristinia sonorae TaxID=1940300 RepID=A0A8K0UWA9_9AGAR|nr:hypothetical protein BXZ70DRAFT_685978 [Cristinia sonorae]